MKPLLKLLFAIFLSLSIVTLFVLQITQISKVSELESDIESINEQLETITDDAITPIDDNGDPIGPTSTDDDSITVKLYYKNYADDPEVLNCIADTYIEKQIPKTNKTLTDTLQLLLTNKLTNEEKEYGLASPFEDPAYIDRFEGFELKTVDINNGIANLTFEDPYYFSSGGSCRTGLIVSMINLTAKQFGNIDRVTLTPSDLFQP